MAILEIWKDIKGFENKYQVSNLGNIRSKNGVLKKQINKTNGYEYVGLVDDNSKTNTKSVHRIVAEAFIDNPNNYPCVNHKDEIRNNNNYINLEWCTYSYNLNYGNRINKFSEAIKKPIYQLDKNTNEIIREWESATDVAKFYNINSMNAHITKCCLGQRKSAYGYKWCYLN